MAGNGDGGHGGAGGTVGAVTDSASATAGGVGSTSGVSGPVRPSGGKQVSVGALFGFFIFLIIRLAEAWFLRFVCCVVSLPLVVPSA